jgi:hypothetical protein
LDWLERDILELDVLVGVVLVWRRWVGHDGGFGSGEIRRVFQVRNKESETKEVIGQLME